MFHLPQTSLFPLSSDFSFPFWLDKLSFPRAPNPPVPRCTAPDTRLSSLPCPASGPTKHASL